MIAKLSIKSFFHVVLLALPCSLLLAQTPATNEQRREFLAGYEVGKTTVAQMLDDGFDGVAPLDGLIGVMQYEATSTQRSYLLGYYQDPPEIDDFARQLASTGFEFIHMQQTNATWGTPEIAALEGAIRVVVCTLVFEANVLAAKECPTL